MLVYRIESVDYLEDEEAYLTGYYSVPYYRRVKIDNLKRPEDKRLSLGAELLLDRMLRENNYDLLADNRVGFYTELGKPYILWSDQKPGKDTVPPVHFSISHSRNYTMCVLSDMVVGCDLEHSDTDRTNCMALARRFFNVEELRYIEADRKEFYKIWTLKEAFCKCTQIPLPTVLKMNMKDSINQMTGDGEPVKGELYSESGLQDGFAWSIVYRA